MRSERIGEKYYFWDRAKMQADGIKICDLTDGALVYSYYRYIPHRMVKKWVKSEMQKYLVVKEYKGGVLLLGFESGGQNLPCSHDPFDVICYDFIIMHKDYKQRDLAHKILKRNRHCARALSVCVDSSGVFYA